MEVEGLHSDPGLSFTLPLSSYTHFQYTSEKLSGIFIVTGKDCYISESSSEVHEQKFFHDNLTLPMPTEKC